MKCAKVISLINLKGGVSKTTTAINMAYILAAEYEKKVLIIDNDKQGNTSKFFERHGYDYAGLSELYTERNFDIRDTIYKTEFKNLSIIPANMKLLKADRSILMDPSRQQQTILLNVLGHVQEDFDYIVIDNPPDLNMCVINALVASTDIIIPIKIDKFSLDGVDQLLEQVEDLKVFNPQLNLAGILITQFAHNKTNIDTADWLRKSGEYTIFNTQIRRTVKIDEMTFSGKPICLHSPRSNASADYKKLVSEYLSK